MIDGKLVTEKVSLTPPMASMRPPMIKGEPPTGYSLVGIFNEEPRLLRWYEAAIKAKDTKPYLMSFDGSLYTLWVKKTKGEGKMLGKGWK
jgi:hypothetical protein